MKPHHSPSSPGKEAAAVPCIAGQLCDLGSPNPMHGSQVSKAQRGQFGDTGAGAGG